MILSPRTTEVVLFQGDDYDEFAERLSAFERAKRTKAGVIPRLTDAAPEVSERAAEYDEFLAAAVDRAVKVTLRAMSPKKWRVLVAAHPMREDEPADRMGFNIETLGDALVPASLVKAVCGDESEDFVSDAAREEFLESLTAGQWDQLYGAALALNTDAGPDPKARLSSTPVPTGDATSTSPKRLG